MKYAHFLRTMGFTGALHRGGAFLTVSTFLLFTGCIGANPFCGGATCPKGEVRDTLCGCTSIESKTKPGPLPSQPNPYYMTARYSCVEAKDPSVSRGSCDLAAWSDSCQNAKKSVLNTVAARGDLCQHCDPPNSDHTRKWDGNPPAWIQGGPCTDESAIQRHSDTEIAAVLPLELPPLDNGIENSSPLIGSTSPPPALVAFALPPSSPITSCMTQCPKNRSSPDCAFSSIPVEFEKPLSTIYARVSKKADDVITPQEIAQIFKVDTSECQRNETKLSSAGIVNTGPSCNVHVDLGKINVRLDITVPTTIAGTFSPTDTGVKITFADPSTSPKVTFHKQTDWDAEHPLNDDFGGKILWVEANSSELYFRTEKGCIGANY